jgi:hypothetical protein
MSQHEPKAEARVEYPNASALAGRAIVQLLTNRPAGAFFVNENETFYFTSGPGTRKRANLDQNPSCTIGIHAGDYNIVAEGTAASTRDAAKVHQFAAFCQSVN